MENKMIKCVVTGNSTGSCCEVCQSKMESIKIVDEDSDLFNKEAEYCWTCYKPEQS